MMQEPASRTIAMMEPATIAGCMLDWQNPDLEPSIDEILADPIVGLVLARDHLNAMDVASFLKAMSRRLTDGTNGAARAAA
jgi:hypothetical protein